MRYPQSQWSGTVSNRSFKIVRENSNSTVRLRRSIRDLLKCNFNEDAAIEAHETGTILKNRALLKACKRFGRDTDPNFAMGG